MLTSCSTERFVALDVHKHYVVVGAVNAQQQVVLAPRRIELDDLSNWSRQHHLVIAPLLEYSCA